MVFIIGGTVSEPYHSNCYSIDSMRLSGTLRRPYLLLFVGIKSRDVILIYVKLLLNNKKNLQIFCVVVHKLLPLQRVRENAMFFH